MKDYSSRFVQLLLIALATFSSLFLAEYLQIEPQAALSIALLILILWCSLTLELPALKRCELAAIILFSVLLSLVFVLGYHIRIDDFYSGTIDGAHINPYGLIDLFALILMAFGIFCILSRCFAAMKGRASGKEPEILNKVRRAFDAFPKRLNWKTILLFAGIMLACWLPTFIIYYPGFVFGDTLSSLEQIASGNYSNHHPFAYTLFLKSCLNVAYLVGLGSTAGCALSTTIQMVLMAWGLGYVCAWIGDTLRAGVGVLLALFFGFSAYIATFSIAMWKDPLFSVALVVFTVLVLDLVAQPAGRGVKPSSPGTRKAVVMLLLALVLCLLRSNGIAVVALEALTFCIFALYRFVRKRGSGLVLLRAGLSLGAVAVVALFVTGPVYSALGVSKSSPAEALGIPINQMARIMALDGNVSDDDKLYMEKLLLGASYAEAYHPSCIDLLKWNPAFDDRVLEDGLWEHWVSMVTKNPAAAFEAWELQTCGFWAPNLRYPFEVWNIGWGAPVNISDTYLDQAHALGVFPRVDTDGDVLRELFPSDGPSVPVAWIFWVVCFLALCCVLLGRPLRALALVPSLALMLSLFIATPIFYWPRYAASLQLLIPVFALMFFGLFRGGHLMLRSHS